MRLNNASLLARLVYSTDLELFDLVLEREGGDLPRALERILEIARSDDRGDPFGALRAYLSAAPGLDASRAPPMGSARFVRNQPATG
jgi:hypothetical protein